jgi:dTDP-3-amino-2,3,6-trideoxy-4-keto-D-glucose/dTDP-3-amino-3,4,6-trideoxy-alpha-D-glucose/dTDP-2,6-dideoxy-D-kanosamine transaminase
VGDGGAIVTSDKAIGEAAERLLQYGWVGKAPGALTGGRNFEWTRFRQQFSQCCCPIWTPSTIRDARFWAAYSDYSTTARVPVRAVNTAAHLAVFLVENRDAFRKHCLDHAILTDVHLPCPRLRSAGLADASEADRSSGITTVARKRAENRHIAVLSADNG